MPKSVFPKDTTEWREWVFKPRPCWLRAGRFNHLTTLPASSLLSTQPFSLLSFNFLPFQLPAFIQLNNIRARTLGRGNSKNIKTILLCLPKQFLFFSFECSNVPNCSCKNPNVWDQLNYRYCALYLFASPNA